jgi:hypothetical protein
MSSFDPTTNRVPMHLLTEEEANIMITWPHGWTTYYSGSFQTVRQEPSRDENHVYRGRLAPPPVTSTWENVGPSGSDGVTCYSREQADKRARALRIAVLRIDMCENVWTAHLEGV